MLQQSAPNRDPNRELIPKGFLRRRTDFLKCYKGSWIRREWFVLYARVNQGERHRLGITAPKTIGSAVTRNRFKRWCRELYRQEDLTGFSESMDFNVQIGHKAKKKEDFKNAKFGDFKRQFHEAFQSLVKSHRPHIRGGD